MATRATDHPSQNPLMYRNQKLLEAVRESPCQHCGRSDGTVVAAHSNQGRDGKGRSLKANDYRIAALCYTCHAELDQGPGNVPGRTFKHVGRRPPGHGGLALRQRHP
jgi:hypothetical protein